MKHVILLILILATSGQAFAAEPQSLEQLKSRVLSYIQTQSATVEQGKPSIRLGHIDSRLKLAACPEDKIKVINPYNRPLSQISTLAVRCEAKHSWKIYVPVKISFKTSVIVAKRFLPRGRRIRAEDITRIETDTKRLKNGYFSDLQAVIGTISKQNIAAGRIIKPNSLKQAKLIYRGDKVHIVAAHPSIRVRMKGVALSSGALGEIIQVKNLSSKKQLEAKVVGRQKVHVNL